MINDSKKFVEESAKRVRVLEDVVCALLRSLSPDDRNPVVFSRVAIEFKSVTGCRFSDYFQKKPSEFAMDYAGERLQFSRDHNTPPLLQCARVKGPWTPIPPPSEDLLEWAKSCSSKEIEDVDLDEAERRFDDRDAVIMAFFRTKAMLQPQATEAGKRFPGDSRSMMGGFCARQPNETCVIGSVHSGVYHHLAENGRGIVVVFNGADDANITAYLPASSLPPGTEMEDLVSKEGRFTIIGRKSPNKILLEPAMQRNFPPLGSKNVIDTIERIGEIEAEVCRLKAMLQSLEDSRVIEAIPLAERVLSASLGRIIAKSIKTWNGRGLTAGEIRQRGVTVYERPAELTDPLATGETSEIPYDAVMQAIRAFRQDI